MPTRLVSVPCSRSSCGGLLAIHGVERGAWLGAAPLLSAHGARGGARITHSLRSGAAARAAAGFMYLRGVSFGDKEYELAVKWMSWMGHELCGVFSVETTLDRHRRMEYLMLRTSSSLARDHRLCCYLARRYTTPRSLLRGS
ncbi:hypothetical protein ERJ75_001575000 [Trypanosoma vivax]|nr:hypothetical protein ERJ75_001575000 [Trypanosoma vivax]